MALMMMAAVTTSPSSSWTLLPPRAFIAISFPPVASGSSLAAITALHQSGRFRDSSIGPLPCRALADFHQALDGLPAHGQAQGDADEVGVLELDRKSTRLNSSHSSISYAVFCLTK